MKKFYLMFLGMVISFTAMAQQGKNGLVLDSLYTTDGDDVRQSMEIDEYNADKMVTASYSYTYFDSNMQHVDMPLIESKSEANYDGDGHLTRMDSYDYNDGEYTLASRAEMSDFDAATGYPKLTVMSAIDEENPSAGLQIAMKTVVTSMTAQGPADEEVYSFEDGEWQLFETVHFEYNADGTLAKETATFYGMTQETTYEYDSNKQVTKKTVSMPAFGMNSVTTYENEYYADGNIKKVTENGEAGTSIDYYFWGDGKAKGGDITAIDAAREQMSKMQRAYDLSGRCQNNTPVRKGLLIVNGKKVIVK